MADANDPNNMRHRRGGEDPSLGAGASNDVPYEQEPMPIEEADAPRRTASARLEVDAQIGSEAAMREAMDPANQSLADALRLSFRVLQAVIVLLVLLFLASSFKTIGDDQTGVLTRWGKIVSVGGEETLTPGLKWAGLFPYPITEFVLCKESNRVIDVGNAFFPDIGARKYQEALDTADASNPVNPARDGWLLTGDGDLMHMKVSARYSIEAPGPFLGHVNDDPGSACNANTIVRLAVQQATVFVAAHHTRDELTGRPDEPKALIKERAQQILNRMKCGIRLDAVEVKDNISPLAIEKAKGLLTEAQQDVRTQIQGAVKSANDTLIGVAGETYPELVKLIDQYEDAVISHDDGKSADVLQKINARLDDPKTTGSVSSILGLAHAYRSQILGSLGAEARRFETILADYHEHPELVIRQKWMEAYSNVLRKSDVETIFVPPGIQTVQVSLSGSAIVQNIRRTNEIERMRLQADLKNANPANVVIERASDMTSGPGRQLKPDASGHLTPAGGAEKN